MGEQTYAGPLEPVYTVAEMAQFLRVSRATVHNLIREKHLYAFKAGRPWRIPQSARDDYFDRIGFMAAPAVT